ncbi:MULTISPECIES: outer membrane beta-barrel protein [unclassified Proteiniphilum]|jgi:hypothetical protein|uniref:outer membrane beta-barrel protein n=1 Tax=Proteiniphilum sp. UBA5259 TaxID=1947269 RepID=UPI000E9A5552|nr:MULTISPECIES: outer membrane beta-barrel protein [unclassified Proteiniphilum]HBF95574.1 hypothetical protein [Porphyromonadaceae bacterium]
MKNQWQNNLRDRMERHEEPAPDGLWNRIEQIMNAGSYNKAVQARRNTLLWGLRIGTVAAVALILFYIGLHTLGLKENVENMQTAEQQLKKNLAPDRHHSPNKPATKIEEQLLAHRAEAGKLTENVSKTTKASTIAETGETVKLQQNDEQQQPQDESYTREETPTQHQADPNPQRPVIETTNTPAFQLPVNRHRRKSAKWQADVYASNIPSGATSTHNGYDSFRPYAFPSEEEEYVVAAVRSDLPEGISVLSEYQHVYTDIEHSQPVVLGVSMQYHLDERWSVTSGLTYTMLSSRLRSGTDNHYYNSRQTLHYVGIPLNVNYTVWENDKISTYVSGGGMVEKNVSGTLSTNFVIDNKLQTRSRQEISVKPLQWSVNSAIGIQHRLTNNIGIYAEPGVAYHFRNGSKVETIYKEKPLNFNVSLGLRFSLNK